MFKFVISICLIVSVLVATLQIDFTHESSKTKESEHTITILNVSLKTIFKAKSTSSEND